MLFKHVFMFHEAKFYVIFLSWLSFFWFFLVPNFILLIFRSYTFLFYFFYFNPFFSILWIFYCSFRVNLLLVFLISFRFVLVVLFFSCGFSQQFSLYHFTIFCFNSFFRFHFAIFLCVNALSMFVCSLF